ncbi:MAG: T9SS type A sorting domain-containing protein [Bacteroidia bacterium]
MRKLLLSTLAFALVLNICTSRAQTIDFVFTVTNASSSTSCDGELDIQCTGCIGSINYTWFDTTGIIGTSNHISGLCISTNDNAYSVLIGDYSCSGPYMFSAIRDATISGTTFQLKTSLQYTNDSTNNYFKIQQVSGGVSPYNYFLNSCLNNDCNNTLYTDYNLTSITNVVFDSLWDPNGENNYTFLVNDSSQNIIGYHFTTVLDTNGLCNPEFFASAQGSPVSDSTACDGTAYVEVYGGTPPYSYQFSTGSTDSTASGLCPGSYIVTVTDAASNTYSTTFVIGYPGTYYYTGGNYNYLDTLYSNAMQDCGIDYSMPIDSFYIDSSYALSNWEYVVNWTIIQDTNQFAFTETYFIDSTGYYMFGISLYCDARSSTFGSYTFFSGAMADMSQTPSGIKDVKADNSVSVYPNPSNGEFYLKASSKIESYTVYDQLGRMVLTKHISTDNESINLSELNNGMYYLTVQFQDGTSGRQKLVIK